jgi:SM-20-related protein
MLPPVRDAADAAPVTGRRKGLAATAMSLGEHGWTMVRDFLEPPAVARLRDEVAARRLAGRFRAAAVGRADAVSIRPAVRSDLLSWIEPGEGAAAVSAYLLAMERLRRVVNRRLYLGLFTLESQFSIYPVDACYQRHLDRFRDSDERRLSCVLYLNDGWKAEDGGQLRLYPPVEGGAEQPVDILPEGGVLVAFLSDRIAHEVLPTRRERLSIAGWFRRREG